MKKIFLPFVLALFWLPAAHAAECQPYVGETLVFDVGWEFVNAGTATMTTTRQGENGYRLHTLAKTNAFFDIFKKVRDTIISEGVCVNGQMQSTKFDLNQYENRYKANKSTAFRWQENKVDFTQNDKTDTYDVPAGHLNVFDAFTKVRTLDLKPGMEIHIPVFDARKTYEVIVHVSEKTERLRAPSGKLVECLIVEPILKTAGVFSSQGKIKIWMTNDRQHVPLKLTAKIKIGRIVGRLVGYTPAS